MMRDVITKALSSTLLRILESDPHIPLQSALERVAQLAQDTDLNVLEEDEVRAFLQTNSKKFSQQGVINPFWLLEHGLAPHFFLINAEPGWLDTLIKDAAIPHTGTSQYIVYGDWDSLIILYGTREEAQDQLQEISRLVHREPRYFSSHDVPLLYRLPSRHLQNSRQAIDPQVVNAVASDYKSEEFAAQRDNLMERGVILGPVWLTDAIPVDRVIAFTGIDVRGREDISSKTLLNLLQQIPILKKTLVHLFRIDQGKPFDFFAKLICENMVELDAATNAIGFAELGPIRLEGSTMVVANGNDQLPLYRAPMIRRVGSRPMMEDLAFLAKEVLAPLGEKAIISFNELSSRRKLAVLASLKDFEAQRDQGGWEAQRQGRIEQAIEMFVRASLGEPGRVVHLTGAVMELAAAVEGVLKLAVRSIVEEIYGRDYGRAQNELRLPTKDFRKLSLGKSAQALQNIKQHPDFQSAHNRLASEWLEKVELFAQLRNEWAHDEAQGERAADSIDTARGVMVLGMEIARWIDTEVLSSDRAPEADRPTTSVTINLPRGREGRDVGVFVSYSSKDAEFAERVATALRAVGYNVWYADWEIGHGDSIVRRIEAGLTQNDTLLVILSPASVKSEWVRRELDTALTRQLSGQNVKIIPILSEECEIPESLASIKYVDFREDFQAGIISTMGALARRRQELDARSRDS